MNMKEKKTIDTDPELIVQKWDQGFRLVRPDKFLHVSGHAKFQRVSDLLNLPINVAFLNTESVIQDCNETLIKISGYKSIKDTIGGTVRAAASREAAEFSINHDLQVAKTNKMIIAEENFVRKVDGVTFQAITTKLPWYNADNKIIGVLCLAITIGCPGSYPLAESIKMLLNTSLLNNSTKLNAGAFVAGLNIMDTYLSKREAQCLQYLLKGSSCKRIAEKLGLSNRTVGHYIDNIRAKMNVHSKEELIEKVLNYFRAQNAGNLISLKRYS